MRVKIKIVYYLVLIFIKIKLLGAQEVANTSSNQGNSPSSVLPRFSDLGGMGFPNFGSGRFGNPTSNYPTNSFFPFGNQNNNIQRPQQSGFDYNPNQGNFQNRPIQSYPNQQGYQNRPGYPYHGDMNPGSNFYYPNQNRPNQGGFPNQDSYPYQGDSSDRYPNYQRPSYSRPGVGSNMYPDYTNRPYYQNGGMSPNQNGNFNRPGSGNSFQYPQANQYPTQGNFQGNANNQNLRPVETNNNFRPDDLGNLPNTNIQLPNGVYEYQPNQYYPPENGQNQNISPNIVQPNNFQSFPTSNNVNTNIQFPTNNPVGMNVGPGTIQYPNVGGSGNIGGVNNIPPNVNTNIQYPTNNPVGINVDPATIQYPNVGGSGNQGSGNNVPPNVNTNIQYPTSNPAGINVDPATIQYPNLGGSGNLGSGNNIPQNQIPNYQGNNPNFNDTAAILGKPVVVPPTLPSQAVPDNSTLAATQKKCVQDCPSTSEYDPICGTDNVTYMNPGRFDCAQKCGVAVSLYQRGRCAGDSLSNTLEQ